MSDGALGHFPTLFLKLWQRNRKIGPPAVTMLSTMAETTLQPGSEGPAGRPEKLRIDWAAKLAEHDRWLRTAVLARLGERQAVDEVMQAVALAAVAQRAPLNDSVRIGAWLYRIAVRQVLLYRRRHGRQRKLLGNYAESRGGDQHSGAVPDPLDWLLQDERKRLLRDALGRLPSRDAEILLLKYSEDWSYQELAVHLGISETAVEARLHRARKRLREAVLFLRPIEVSK
jgi:RNA polymerase sigma factor (sigma-70 family)